MSLKHIIKFLFLLFIGITAGFYFLTHEGIDRAFFVNTIPCEEPLTYSIGDIDTRFGINRKDVSEAMAVASELWSDALGKPTAIQSDESTVTVNFVYDDRQKLVDGEFRFRERINSEQIRMNQMQAEYDQLRERFDRRSAEYVRFAEQTTEELNNLNEWVNGKNSGSGFTESDVEQFERRKAAVEQMQNRVLNERRELDRLAAEINRETDRLNQKIDENNRLIDQYNEEYSGENRFTKATYQNTPKGGLITVNTFLNKSELTLILAHELGHALGLNHVANPKSVMYSLMGGQELFPVIQFTQEDLHAIKRLCN